MVVVISHPGFISGRRVRGFDAAEEPGIAEVREDHINRLHGNVSQLTPNTFRHGLGSAVRGVIDSGEDGETLFGDTAVFGMQGVRPL
ncbi:hypothetical protein GCM10009611_17450 [Arthrobacter roseus]